MNLSHVKLDAHNILHGNKSAFHLINLTMKSRIACKLNISSCCARVIFLLFFFHFTYSHTPFSYSQTSFRAKKVEKSSDLEVLNGTFLGNHQRNYYGNLAPDTLSVIWKFNLGKGMTVISRKLGSCIWAGAGWTGQPLLVKEKNKLYLIQGAYDHNLKKIDAETGEMIWNYKFDDVIKGTGSIWINPKPKSEDDRIVILQGSRLGIKNYLNSKHIPSYRAISYLTGKELWRLDVKWTKSYSRDADGSALILNNLAYIGLENSLFTVINPEPDSCQLLDSMIQPKILKELRLYTEKDVINHKGNVVTESSPCLLNNHIYISSGSGHIWGYNLESGHLDWDFYVGSDIDGSPVVTSDSCLLVSIERQYIKGKGGVFKLNPKLPPDSSVVWFFPTENCKVEKWEGGIIGSCSINDKYISHEDRKLAAFSAIDGNLYVVNHQQIEENKLVLGPDKMKKYPTPKLVFKYKTGPSISTPLLFDSCLIAAGYKGIFVFKYDKNSNFHFKEKFSGEFEATPVCWNKKLFAASRNGYLYCLGLKE